VNYCAAKAGIIGITRTVSKEMASRNITVNAVAPGFIETEMTQQLPEEVQKRIIENISLNRIGRPEEVAEVVAFLATRGSYISGSVVHVNGGLYGG
jgi:3-oxoacyl-[acyl-carrier protein] reductase